MKHTKCPACQSQNTTEATGQFAGSGLQAFKNRICLDCGTAWRPQCPRWLAVAFIVVGCALPVIQSATVKASSELDSAMGKPVQAQPGSSANWGFFAVGGTAIGYGLLALFGKASKMEILGKAEEHKE